MIVFTQLNYLHPKQNTALRCVAIHGRIETYSEWRWEQDKGVLRYSFVNAKNATLNLAVLHSIFLASADAWMVDVGGGKEII